MDKQSFQTTPPPGRGLKLTNNIFSVVSTPSGCGYKQVGVHKIAVGGANCGNKRQSYNKKLKR